jgi:hypothetical protein
LSSTGLDPPSIDVIRSIVQRAFEESRLGCDVVLQHVSEMSLSERLLDTEQVGSQGVMPVEGGKSYSLALYLNTTCVCAELTLLC